ncbi:hypothetical protein JW935_22565 [candidate division KSB1 bacterium]|nr:hypothetical protein [candidate division KSB1 bacterium]
MAAGTYTENITMGSGKTLYGSGKTSTTVNGDLTMTNNNYTMLLPCRWPAPKIVPQPL